MSEIQAKRYQVFGRVQGVGFRYFVQRTAVELGVFGWVRNRPDGSVEALAEGADETLTVFAAALRKGPLVSRVDRVQESPAAVSGATAFRITS